MLLLAYSRSRVDSLIEFDALLALLMEQMSISILLFAQDERRPATSAYDPVSAADIFRADHAVGVYSPGLLSLSLDCREFYGRHRVVPHSRMELNFSQLSDGPVLELLMKKVGALYDIEFGAILPTESFIREYNVNPLGVGIGLVDIYWITYLSKGFTQILLPAREPSRYFKRYVDESKGSTVLVATPRYEQFGQLDGNARFPFKEELGLPLFTAYSANVRQPTGGQSWAFSPANLLRFVAALSRPLWTDSFKAQAQLVPVYYRKEVVAKAGGHS